MAVKNTPLPAAQEENPTSGGSYTRNPDGTLTQTEGAKPQPDSAPAAANPTPTTQEQ